MPRGNGVEGDEVVEVGRSLRPASALPLAVTSKDITSGLAMAKPYED
jgi:hypothetical protein